MSSWPLVLGVDGGGSKTVARIAEVRSGGEIVHLCEGHSGPSNASAIGLDQTKQSLKTAINEACDRGEIRRKISSAVLALAGCSQDPIRTSLSRWACEKKLAESTCIVPDAEPVLAIASRNGEGVALIVGTGSVAIAKDGQGNRKTTGGWGHWFGDSGSGFDLGRRALVAVVDAVDQVGPETILIERVLKSLNTDNPRKLLTLLGADHDVRREIATLAPLLLQSAELGDEVALKIASVAAKSTAKLVDVAARSLQSKQYRLAVAGSVVCKNSFYRNLLLDNLCLLGSSPATVKIVNEPVDGSLLMARDCLVQK